MANVKKCLVKNLTSDLLEDNVDGTVYNIIPSEYDEKEIYCVIDKSRSETGRETFRQLNIRYIKTQLGIEFENIDKRELWYIVRNKLGGVIDLKGASDQQYISFSGMIRNFCEAIAPVQNFEYWGFALEYLGVPSKDVVIVYDNNLNTRTLTIENVDNYGNTPYFIVICEKHATLDDFVKELKSRGYDRGFLGFVLGGYAVTSVIRLMLRLKDKTKFNIITLTDFDLNGMQIYLDLLRYCPNLFIQNGVNPEFLNYANIKFNSVCEDYKAGNVDQLILGCENMIDEINIEHSEKLKLKSWVDMVKTQRVELNAITAGNIAKGKKKIGVFVDYFETKINGKVWDLNRDTVPNVNKPSYINSIISKIESKATELIDKYLGDLRYSSGWFKQIPELNEMYEKFKIENENYNDSLTNVNKHISNQNKKLKKVLENSKLYSDVENKLNYLQDTIINKLDDLEPDNIDEKDEEI